MKHLALLVAALGIGAMLAPPVVLASPAIHQAIPLLDAAPAASGAMTPLGTFGVRRIASITTTKQALSDIMAPVVCSCGYVIMNSAAGSNQLNVGGPDVDNSTNFFSICASGCDTAGPVTITAREQAVVVRAASTTVTTAVVWCGGGC